MKRMYSVSALWDDEAKVFHSESDIEGLHIEAETIEEFQNLVAEYAPELILSNHVAQRDLATIALGDLIPAILVHVPDRTASAA